MPPSPLPRSPVEHVLDLLDRLARGVLSLMILGIFGILLAQVLMRYVFSAPLYWAEELAKYLMVYVTSIGAAVAYRHYGHPRLMIVLGQLGPRAALWYDLVLRIPVAVFFVYFAHTGWTYAWANEWMTTPGLNVSFFWPFLAIPVGAGLVLAYLAFDTLNILIYRRSWLMEPEPGDPAETVEMLT
ncbi:TRAP transporter small permease [Salipiger marinus]|uniref:TRAP transporter small permease protein n=1 Tax=Salipiger marinus TaxID=555512 RepID=A0A1G8TCT9_9RHOB|nr:TRAP transporter small permease [Salipiger marinus]SDJ39204.1 TRAP-type C4-dicarboxylate transport system, small permease component [Salipiger marinus]